MTRYNTRPPAIVLTCLSLAACATAGAPPDAAPAPDPAAASGYLSDSATRVEHRYYTGPQPTLADLASLKASGVKRVINFRTPAEMAELDFDEGAVLAELGIEYAHIPVGGDDYPYSPAQLDALTRALGNDDAPAVLHCRSGHRASVLLVAYLVEEKGMDINDALRHARGWWPLALEDVLGRRLVLGEAGETDTR